MKHPRFVSARIGKNARNLGALTGPSVSTPPGFYDDGTPVELKDSERCIALNSQKPTPWRCGARKTQGTEFCNVHRKRAKQQQSGANG